MVWGQPRKTSDLSTGTAGQIELAHEALDKLGVKGGPLALRVLELIGILDREREKKRDEPCICPWHDEAVATYPNTSHRHAEVMLRIHQDERIPVVYNAATGEHVLRSTTVLEERYIDGGDYPTGWEKKGLPHMDEVMEAFKNNNVSVEWMKAQIFGCCHAGRVSWPEPCPWHGEQKGL